MLPAKKKAQLAQPFNTLVFALAKQTLISDLYRCWYIFFQLRTERGK